MRSCFRIFLHCLNNSLLDRALCCWYKYVRCKSCWLVFGFCITCWESRTRRAQTRWNLSTCFTISSLNAVSSLSTRIDNFTHSVWQQVTSDSTHCDWILDYEFWLWMYPVQCGPAMCLQTEGQWTQRAAVSHTGKSLSLTVEFCLIWSYFAHEEQRHRRDPSSFCWHMLRQIKHQCICILFTRFDLFCSIASNDLFLSATSYKRTLNNSVAVMRRINKCTHEYSHI